VQETAADRREKRRRSGGRAKAAAAIASRLTFEAIERRYGETMALAGVTLDVAPGEVVCLLGPSGCGKTTLLRLAAGIEKPSAGRVLLDGLEVAGPERFVPPERRNVGLVFQDFALFPHLTNLQNVAFGLRTLPAGEARAVAIGLLARVGLERFADDYPASLSGGEMQRVALARAIAPRPSILLMDEPFSGLDVQLRRAMQEETLAILRETGATSIIVTHDPQEAMRLADRIVVLGRGRVVQTGRAATLYHAPESLFVARLFSEINEIEAVVSGGCLTTPFGEIGAAGLAEGTHAVICIRQRAVELKAKGAGVEARIVDVKFLGDAQVVELVVQGLEETLAAEVPAGSGYRRGDEVAVFVEPTTILVFPAEVEFDL
jgi:iron(III) transport system ATP-binding protein